jgi:hypothetical protein
MDNEATDAARYRWLRAQDWFNSSLFVVRPEGRKLLLGMDCPSLFRLDDYIDEQLAKLAKKNESA